MGLDRRPPVELHARGPWKSKLFVVLLVVASFYSRVEASTKLDAAYCNRSKAGYLPVFEPSLRGESGALDAGIYYAPIR